MFVCCCFFFSLGIDPRARSPHPCRRTDFHMQRQAGTAVNVLDLKALAAVLPCFQLCSSWLVRYPRRLKQLHAHTRRWPLNASSKGHDKINVPPRPRARPTGPREESHDSTRYHSLSFSCPPLHRQRGVGVFFCLLKSLMFRRKSARQRRKVARPRMTYSSAATHGNSSRRLEGCRVRCPVASELTHFRQ